MSSTEIFTSPAMAAACPELSHAARPDGSTAAGLPGSASPFGGSRLRGTGLSGAGTAGLGLSASAVCAVSERATKAPTAVVAQAHAYAAAEGAADGTCWNDDAKSFLEGRDAVVTTKQQTKRAFRGLEPWRDPA